MSEQDDLERYNEERRQEDAYYEEQERRRQEEADAERAWESSRCPECGTSPNDPHADCDTCVTGMKAGGPR